MGNYKSSYTGSQIDEKLGLVPSQTSQNQWDAAYGWGNHASAGYLGSGDNVSELTNDAGYLGSGDNVSDLVNDANYVANGDNVSDLTNDAGYIVSTTGNTILMTLSGTAATDNATLLNAAYTAAKALTPHGNALAADNRAAVIILGNGIIDYGTGDGSNNGLVMDTNYVDLIGVGNITITSQINTASRGTVKVNNINTIIENITFDINITASVGSNATEESAFYILANASNVTVKNCMFSASGAGGKSMRTHTNITGTFKNVTAGDYSFGYEATTVSGTFTDCVGGDWSFGASLGTTTASGTFIRCTGGATSFGYGSTASGTFEYCTGGNSSFGYAGISSGTFNYCKLTSGVFTFAGATPTVGSWNHCIDGNGDIWPRNNISEVIVVTSVGSPYTPTKYDQTILVDASSGNVAINLDALANYPSGMTLNIKAIDVSNSVTLDANGAETIDGGTAAIPITTLNKCLTVQSLNHAPFTSDAGWYIL